MSVAPKETVPYARHRMVERRARNAEQRAQRAEAVVEAARRAAKSLRSLEYAPALHGDRARSALDAALAAYDTEASNGE